MVELLVKSKAEQMRKNSLSPSRAEVLDVVWGSLLRGRSQVIAQGISEVDLEGDLVIIQDIILEMKRAESSLISEESACNLRSIFDRAVERAILLQRKSGLAVSPVNAIDVVLSNLLANVDAFAPHTPYPDEDVRQRKEFIRSYAATLREKAMMC